MVFWSSRIRTGLVVAFALATLAACRRGTTGETPAPSEGAPECEAYASDYERCLAGAAPNAQVAREVAEKAREALRVAAKDPESVDRMNEKCRAARAQLSTTCR
jgi:hypothetical protein